MTTEEYLAEKSIHIQIPGSILNENPYSNIDILYGPYNSLEDACNVVIQEIRQQGLTVGVIENGEVVEYWWNTNDVSGLPVKKNKGLNNKIYLKQETVTTTEDGQDITITNALTQSLFETTEGTGTIPRTNTIFVIQEDFDLNGLIIEIPSGCTLLFKNGSLSNGTLIGNGTKIISEKVAIFTGITISGTWNVPEITSAWFSDAANNNGLRNVFALQNADVYNRIIIEKGDYIVSAPEERDDGLLCLSNLELIIEGNITLLPNNFTNHYYIISIINQTNVIISGSGVITGDKLTHTGSTGEWGHGIYITGSFITVKDIKVKECWGDCICINGTENTPFETHNIIIDNVWLDSGRRQGISVIEGDNVSITNCRITNVGGTPPQSAIDIEPNDGQAVNCVHIDNVYIDNCVLGIRIIGGEERYTSTVTIENCFIKTISYAFEFSGPYSAVTVINNHVETKYSSIYCNIINRSKEHVVLFENNIIKLTEIPAEDSGYEEDFYAIYCLKGNYEFSHNYINTVLPTFNPGAGMVIADNTIVCPILFYFEKGTRRDNLKIIRNNITGNIMIPGTYSIIDGNTVNGTIVTTTANADRSSRITNNSILNTGGFTELVENPDTHEMEEVVVVFKVSNADYIAHNRFQNIVLDINGGKFVDNKVEFTDDFIYSKDLVFRNNSILKGNSLCTTDGTLSADTITFSNNVKISKCFVKAGALNNYSIEDETKKYYSNCAIEYCVIDTDIIDIGHYAVIDGSTINAKTINLGQHTTIRGCALTCTELLENIDDSFYFLSGDTYSIIENNTIKGIVKVRGYSSVINNTLEVKTVLKHYAITSSVFCKITNNNLTIKYGTGILYTIIGLGNYGEFSRNYVIIDNNYELSELTQYLVNVGSSNNGIIADNYFSKYEGLTQRYGGLSGIADYYKLDDNFKNHLGTSEQRPIPDSKEIGFEYYDTTIGKPTYWNGTQWKDSIGEAVTWPLVYTLTNLTASNHIQPNAGVSYTTILTADDGYELPTSIIVKFGTNALVNGTDYTYDQSTGEIVVFGIGGTGGVTDILEIKAYGR